VPRRHAQYSWRVLRVVEHTSSWATRNYCWYHQITLDTSSNTWFVRQSHSWHITMAHEKYVMKGTQSSVYDPTFMKICYECGTIVHKKCVTNVKKCVTNVEGNVSRMWNWGQYRFSQNTLLYDAPRELCSTNSIIEITHNMHRNNTQGAVYMYIYIHIYIYIYIIEIIHNVRPNNLQWKPTENMQCLILILNYRTLLQNIASFVGLFCKRDL